MQNVNVIVSEKPTNGEGHMSAAQKLEVTWLRLDNGCYAQVVAGMPVLFRIPAGLDQDACAVLLAASRYFIFLETGFIVRMGELREVEGGFECELMARAS